jgi:membrane protease YdiL (CAAX protease family)
VASPDPAEGGEAPDRAGGAESPVILVPLSPPRPWGPWATIGWTVLCIGVMIGVQIAVVIAFVTFRVVTNSRAKFEDLASDGNLIAVAALSSAPFVIGLIGLLIKIKRHRLRDYLALNLPSSRQVLFAVGGMLLLIVGSDLTSYLTGRPIVTPFMEGVYQTAWFPLLLLGIVVAAPLWEEVLMRGFLFKGIAASWGAFTAILLSSFVWAILHINYDVYGIATIFVMGLFLGVVVRRTDSLPLTILLHGIMNAVATAEVIIKTRWMR